VAASHKDGWQQNLQFEQMIAVVEGKRAMAIRELR